MKSYSERVRELIAEGFPYTDAQGVVDAEIILGAYYPDMEEVD